MKRLWRLALALLLALAWSPAPITQAADCVDEAVLVETELDPADGIVAPGATLTVVWTVRNDGDCTWDREYRLLFVGGDRMEGARTARLRSRVTPGATLDLTLDLTAPAEAGEYSGVWRLRGPEGASFGPDLTAAVEVSEDALAGAEIVLPEVLAFGGMGAGGDDESVDPCVDAGGVLLAEPGIAVDTTSFDYRYVTLYVCGFDAGSQITVVAAGPEELSFSRSYTVGEAKVYTDTAGLEYDQTWLWVNLHWIDSAPSGEWVVTAGDGELEVATVLDVPEVEVGEDYGYPRLDNYPTGPADPFAAAEGCTYAYRPGESFVITGWNLPPEATMYLGLYQERLAQAYLLDTQVVTTQADGTVHIEYTAPEPGNYHLELVRTVDPSGYLSDDTVYEAYFGEDSAASCFTVKGPEMEVPWRLALAQGEPGSANLIGMDMISGLGIFPTYFYGECESTHPAWWPDGMWLLYTSNCIATGPDEEAGFTSYVAGAYDLYAVEVSMGNDWDWNYEPLQMTATPDLDETDPSASVDGLLAYRQAPAGTPLEESGELWVLDVEAGEVYDLGLTGRAPAWSPDGTQLAFMSDLEGAWHIYVYDIAAERLWMVDERCPSHCRFPAWSPDGNELAYSSTVSEQDLTPNALWIAPVEGGRARRLVSGEFDHPAWSAEGWIAFSGVDGLYRVAAAQRSAQAERYLYAQVDQEGPMREPVWSR